MGSIERVVIVSVIAVAAGCGSEAAVPGPEQPPQTYRGGSNPCGSETLNVCVGPFTGPACDLPCDVGGGSGGGTTTGEELLGTTGGPPEGCEYRVYCHDDESLYGIAVFNAHLFEFSPTDTPAQITSAFESFVAQHEADLELATGLTTSDLSFAPADNFVVDQGQLWLYRFVQTYPLRSSVHIPLIDASALLSLEADNEGAVTLKGTVVDTRVTYTNWEDQATQANAELSIIKHAIVLTGHDEKDIVVDSLQLVAVPSLQRVAWFGAPRVGPVALAHVLVDADPAEAGTLDLLRWDEGTVPGLFDTDPVSVRTQDLSASDPWASPVPESVETTRADGEPLLGSIYDGNNETQLGTTEVVVLDLLGNTFEIMAPTSFERFTDAMGSFEVAQPGDQFNPQRLYHLAQSGYATIDRVALGKWDSAVQYRDPNLASDFDPGTYRPRFIVGYDHASVGAVARSGRFLPPPGNPMDPLDAESWFPEAYLRPRSEQLLASTRGHRNTADTGRLHCDRRCAA